MATEQRFSVRPNIRYKPLHRQHDWNSSEEQDEDEEEAQLPDSTIRRQVAGQEFLPRNDGAEEYEHCAVEYQVDNGWERELFCFLREPAVVRKADPSTESYEEVVAPQDGPDAYGEDGEEQVEDYEGGAGDVSPLVGEAEESVGAVAYEQAESNAQDALPEHGDQDPFFDCFAGAGVFQGTEADEEEGEGDAVVAGGFRG